MKGFWLVHFCYICFLIYIFAKEKQNMAAYFNVMKKPNVGTITSLYAVGDYAHAVSNVTPINLLSHVSINNYSGIMVTYPYGSSFLSTPSAVASFIGTW